MASKAVESLNQWLAQAEEVLAESYQDALSPSSSDLAESVQNEWEVSLASFGLGLPDLLERLCSRPGRWILIAEDASRPHRFWQAMAFEDGSLLVEAGTGTASVASERLTSDEEIRLDAIGWQPPVLPSCPNWQRVEATTCPDITAVTEQALETLGDAFGIESHGRLLLTLFSSPRRGGTPASELILDETLTDKPPATRRGIQPTDEVWAEYYRQMFPKYDESDSEFATWKYATKAVDVAMACWNIREQKRIDWESRYGTDPTAWPTGHPSIAIRISRLFWAGCLGCSWIQRSGPTDAETAESLAHNHSAEARTVAIAPQVVTQVSRKLDETH